MDALAVPNRTVLVPWDAPKLLPETVTLEPTAPLLGFSADIAGGCCCVTTVKVDALLDTPFTTTVTDCAPAVTFGTTALIDVALDALTEAFVVPKRSVLPPWVLPKLLPEIVTLVPTVPLVGLTEAMPGVVPTVSSGRSEER